MNSCITAHVTYQMVVSFFNTLVAVETQTDGEGREACWSWCWRMIPDRCTFRCAGTLVTSEATLVAPAFHSRWIIVSFLPNLIRIQSIRGLFDGGFSSPGTKMQKQGWIMFCRRKEKVIPNLPFQGKSVRLRGHRGLRGAGSHSRIVLCRVAHVQQCYCLSYRMWKGFYSLFCSDPFAGFCWKGSRNCLPLSTLPLPPPQKYNPSAPPHPPRRSSQSF